MELERKTGETDDHKRDTTLQIEVPEFHSAEARPPLRKNFCSSFKNKKTKKISSRRPHKDDSQPGAEQPVHIPGVEAVKPQGKEMHTHEDEDEEDDYDEGEDLSFYRQLFCNLTFLYGLPLFLLVWTFYSPTLKAYMSQPTGLMSFVLGIILNLLLGYLHLIHICTRFFPANYFMNLMSSCCIFMVTAYISMKLANAFFVIMSIFFGITCLAFINWILMLLTIKIRYGFKVIGIITVTGTVLSLVFLLLIARIVFKAKATTTQIIATLALGALFNFLPYLKLYMILSGWSVSVGTHEGAYAAWIMSHAYYTVSLVLVRKIETYQR